MLGGSQDTTADYGYGSDDIICNHGSERDLPPVKLDAIENESPSSPVRNITPPISIPRTVSRRKNQLCSYHAHSADREQFGRLETTDYQ